MLHPARAGRAWMAVPVLAAGVLALSNASAFAADTLPIYNVTQEGMTSDQGAKLADAFGIPNSVQSDGAFAYTAKNFDAVPQRAVAEGKDESGSPTTSLALDTTALAKLTPVPDDVALKSASRLADLAGLNPDMEATPSVSNTKLTLSDRAGRATADYALDTTVSYRLTLNGLPVTGQGARLRVAYNSAGDVVQLSDAMRSLERGKDVPVITPDAAAKSCAALYGPGVRQATPTLGYLMPALGAVKTIYPVDRDRRPGAPPGPGRAGRRARGEAAGRLAGRRRQRVRRAFGRHRAVHVQVVVLVDGHPRQHRAEGQLPARAA
jgi:hypothetical protein